MIGGSVSRPRAAVAIAVAAVIMLVLVFVVMTAPPPTVDSWSQAVESEDLSMARRLAETDADPDSEIVLGFTPLMRAAIRDSAAIAELLISSGADVNAEAAESLSPIHLAAQRNSPGVAELLVEAGADVTKRSSNGMNALDHAADAGALEVGDLLIRFGLDVNEPSEVVAQGHGYPRDRGAPPIGIATRADRLAMVEMLIEKGADVDRLSQSGLSALHIAVFSGASTELVALLLASGSNPLLVAECNEACSGLPGTALEWALRLERRALVDVLDRATGPTP